MEKHIKVEVTLNKGLYDELLKITEYEKLDNHYRNFQIEETNVENYIRGLIVNDLKTIDALRELSNKDFRHRKLQNNFKKLMDEYNVTLTELEEVTEINISNLSRILNNKVQPSLESFVRLWNCFFFIPLDEVLYRE